jgi:lipopolysaccharide/colanic/teichoic acid biosynthesis glycosyltransferase
MKVNAHLIAKRLFDYCASLVLLVLLLPLLLIIALGIKMDSRGPVLFKQKRLSKNGKMFTIYKFRSMINNAEIIGTGLFNYQNDFRVTRIGRFLRKTSIDELPQLINIIKGDLSVVGPRPPVSYELGSYEKLSPIFKRRFDVLPGVTGLAQISGRNELPWDIKVAYDNQYIDLFGKYGLGLDMWIIAKTIHKVFFMEDIYEVKEGSLINLSDEEIAKKATENVITKASTT